MTAQDLSVSGAVGNGPHSLAEAIKNRWDAGEAPNTQTALRECPELRAHKSVILGLALEEYCLRLEAGEEVDSEQFCRRFPTYGASLRRLLDVHEFAAKNPRPVVKQDRCTWPKPGDRFHDFTLVNELGRGAFARVFLATQAALGNRYVALKVSQQGATEAQTLGRLNHRNIVTIYSVDRDPRTGLTVACMPYLGNATLCDVLDQVEAMTRRPTTADIILKAIADKALPERPPTDPPTPDSTLSKGTYVDGILHLAVQMADALAYIHAEGVCHRDLKPSNVLLTPTGKPMLLDFNLSFDQLANDHRLGGTLPYMSPQQLLAIQAKDGTGSLLLDERSDIYSLGVILYELLTGRHPFGLTSMKQSLAEIKESLLEKQLAGPGALRSLNREVDSPLARLVERCLAYNPKDRPATAAELATEFRKGLRWDRRGRRWVRMHPLVAAGVMVAVIGVGTAHASYLAVRDPASVRQVKDAWADYHAGRYDQAIEAFTHAIRGQKQDGELYYGRGRAFLKTKDWVAASADFEKAAGLLPDGQANACLGYCLNHMSGNDGIAALEYKKARSKGLDNARLWNNLGYSILERVKVAQEIDAARECFGEAIEREPTLQAAYYNRARALQKQSTMSRAATPDSATEDIEEAIRLGPVSADLYRIGALMYATVRNSESAEYRKRCLDLLRLSIRFGYDRNQLGRDYAFRNLHSLPEFADVLQEPRLTERVLYFPPRFLDPVRDPDQR